MSQHDAAPELDDRPRLRSVRFGVNPNSSSLGVDVTFLLFGGAGALALGLVASALLRGRKGFTEVGKAEALPPAADAPESP